MKKVRREFRHADARSGGTPGLRGRADHRRQSLRSVRESLAAIRLGGAASRASIHRSKRTCYRDPVAGCQEESLSFSRREQPRLQCRLLAVAKLHGTDPVAGSNRGEGFAITASSTAFPRAAARSVWSPPRSPFSEVMEFVGARKQEHDFETNRIWFTRAESRIILFARRRKHGSCVASQKYRRALSPAPLNRPPHRLAGRR